METSDILILPVDDTIKSKTAENVVRKFNHTDESLMYNRTPVELLDNLYMGDIAKNALCSYLRERVTTQVIDYDEIRTDDFMHPDPGWDLMIGNKKLKVEVKSSIPPNDESNQDIISKRDIKITASHDKDAETLVLIKPDDLESYIHVQIYFRAKTYTKGYDTFEKLSAEISKDPTAVLRIIAASKYDKPYFFGWTTKKQIKAYLQECLKNKRPLTWTFDWTKRLYWRSPIEQAFNMDKLIEVANQY